MCVCLMTREHVVYRTAACLSRDVSVLVALSKVALLVQKTGCSGKDDANKYCHQPAIDGYSHQQEKRNIRMKSTRVEQP